MPITKLREYLEKNGVPYEIVTHAPAFTAQRTADSAHITGKELAKTVMVKVDGDLAMAVLPAASKVNMDVLQEMLGAEHVRLASESDFKDVFPDCEVGAMPPFGNLYGVEVYVAQDLSEHETVAFNACSHTELLRMAYRDFERLVQPRVLAFTYR